MISRILSVVVVTLAMALSSQSADAAYSPSQRAAIRSMPITQRPYRPGHFYGNTVRALNRVRAY